MYHWLYEGTETLAKRRHDGSNGFARSIRRAEDEKVIAVRNNLIRLGFFRDEVLAADEDGGGTMRESFTTLLGYGFGPATLTAAGAGTVIAGPVGAAIGAGVAAAGVFAGVATVATLGVKARSSATDMPDLDVWDFGFDNKFARRLKGNLPAGAGSPSTQPARLSQPCSVCDLILNDKMFIPLEFKNTPSKFCQLCSLIYSAAETWRNSESRGLKRYGSTIVMYNTRMLPQAPLVRLCSDIMLPEQPKGDFQLSFPTLPSTKEFRFTLLRHWLKWCDQNHKCNHTQDKEMPPRLIDLGKSLNDPPKLISSLGMKPCKYIAISHRWGLTAEERKRYSTVRDNFETQKEKIERIAPTFKDAIEVARAVGIRYLWIDSLCIIQQYLEDWEEQSKVMKGVYASAYLTIAATAARDMNETFLQRTSHKKGRVCFDNGHGQPIYACSDVGDFDNEVENAELNGRAWILQERLLACRTIHFGAGQMYWECGEGVYCEDLTRLGTSSGRKKHFKMDPEFPRLLYDSGVAQTMYFIQALLEDYSTRGISKTEDRAVAISGLQDRMATALSCQARCGVFELFFQRGLLWKRTGKKSPRISYANRKVPSWSWMAYEGGIQFLDIPFGKFMFFNPLVFHKTDQEVLITEIWSFGDCRPVQSGTGHGQRRLIDEAGKKAGSIVYDVELAQVFEPSLCVIVGRSEVSGLQYHILAVKETETGDYERIGVGWVRIECISAKVKSGARLV